MEQCTTSTCDSHILNCGVRRRRRVSRIISLLAPIGDEERTNRIINCETHIPNTRTSHTDFFGFFSLLNDVWWQTWSTFKRCSFSSAIRRVEILRINKEHVIINSSNSSYCRNSRINTFRSHAISLAATESESLRTSGRQACVCVPVRVHKYE